MRTKEATKNTIYSLCSYVFILIVGFVSQRIFKDVLGQSYLGLHSLFSNIMSMLAVAELGFGTAIVSNMYKPVADNDYIQINALLQFYHKIYMALAGIILCFGLLILPFLKLIVGDQEIKGVNLYIVYLFYLADTVFSYLITYKRSIIYANQKAYYTNITHTIFVVSMNIAQIILLINIGNYYIYLLFRVIFRLGENIFINIIANKLFPYIKTKKNYSVEKNIKQSIFLKVKGLLFHRIGTFLVLGSDNIIITVLPNLGLLSTGAYSNYLMIINQLNTIISQVFSSITASIGNLLIEENNEKSYVVFRRLHLMNAWIYIFTSISFYYISFPFIELWMGSSYVFPKLVVFVLSVNMFISGMRISYGSFKDAAGIFYEDRFVPIVESIVNILVSVLLGYYWGLVGVFIGTICSNLVLFIWSFPNFVYKRLFNKENQVYFYDIIKWICQFAVCFTVTQFVFYFIPNYSSLIYLLLSVVVCLIIPNILLCLFNYKSEEFKYYTKLLEKLRIKRV